MDVKFFDSIYEGDSPNGSKLCMGLTGGDFWPRISGCQLLYRGYNMALVDFASILTATELDVSSVSPPANVEHGSGTTYFYVIRCANNCGDQDCTLAASVKVAIDVNGDLAMPQPNGIFELNGEQFAGSKVRLLWYYCPLEQEQKPVCFKVYYDSGTGQIDYQNTIATISYSGRKFYNYESDPLEAGKYLFVVRAEGSDGTEDISLLAVSVEIDSTSPETINILNTKSI